MVIARGKLVGGSSALNYLAWGRASKEDYDALSQLGNSGWNWDGFLPYLKKVEGTEDLTAEAATQFGMGDPSNAFHGKSGPLKKSILHQWNELHMPFLDALVNVGIPRNDDTGSGNNVGTFTGYSTIDSLSKTRSYAATAYYAPIADRKNLTVLTEARSLRVVFEPDSDGELVATAVEIVENGAQSIVKASKEVILCAGTYMSPPLLELSGIGQTDLLNKHGIKQLVDLPVGENLQDHPWVGVQTEINSKYDTVDVLQDPARLGQEIQLYQEKKEGMLAVGFAAYGFAPLTTVMDNNEIKNFIDKFESSYPTDTNAFKKEKQLLKEWFLSPEHAHIEYVQLPLFLSYSPKFKAEPGKRYHCNMVGLLHPLSRGSVHISSSDPLANPLIDTGYLTNPLDVERLVAGVKLMRKITKTAPYSNGVDGIYDPPEDVFGNDDKLVEWIREKVESFNHPIGTVPMLPRADGGVVDSSLKVYGTKNLRVADASIIPLQISAHIQHTVYAIAEKAADMIKFEHQIN
ncbi:hypothetical protein VKT23_009946 [Stygiomarasmius scandens]|uniref:Glucose-methanol-choline oxidoreductase N-terminal domain-containing protein n=1 Tax=Marasmiellus scandens TaxID=2682957 RepID=A0ABR1JIF5_9AGAR